MTEVYIADTECIRDEAYARRLFDSLNEIRQDKISKNKNTSDKLRSLVAGCLLKYAIEQHGMEYLKCEFEVEASGYERIKSTDYYFSLSHSGKYCICAWSDMPIGADIECISRFSDQKLDNLISRIMTDKEKNIYDKCKLNEKDRYFAQVWTRKEAYAKAIKRGIAMDLSSIETNCDEIFFTYTDVSGYCISVAGNEKFDKSDIVFRTVTGFLEGSNA